MLLSEERREALQQAVKEINIFTVKTDAAFFDRDKLAFIETVEGYHQSCCGDNTWKWDASAWGQAILLFF
jgi:hypothetical protein